jgi:hypothetical protein
MRAGAFGAHHILTRASAVTRVLAMDLPSLVFCSAFGALAWFWSDVYHNAKRERRAGRRTFIIYVINNIAMYVFLCADGVSVELRRLHVHHVRYSTHHHAPKIPE